MSTTFTAYKVFRTLNSNLYSCCGFGKQKRIPYHKYIHCKKWFESTSIITHTNAIFMGWYSFRSLADAVEYRKWVQQQRPNTLYTIYKIACKGRINNGIEKDTQKLLPIIVTEYIKVLERVEGE